MKIASKEGEIFFKTLEQTCKDNSYPKSGIVFSVKRVWTSEVCWDVDLYGNDATARIEFYIPFKNSTRANFDGFDDAHLRVYGANYNLFDSYNRISDKDKRSYEKVYYLSLNEDKEPIWSEEKRANDGVGTTAILKKLFIEFYEFSKKHR